MASMNAEANAGGPRPGVSAAVFRNGKVLLARRAKPPLQDLWSLPGGHIEVGETALEAAHRELAEETGITADLKALAGVRDVILRGDDGTVIAHHVLAVFCGLWARGEARPGGDCREVCWEDPATLDQLEMTDGAAEIIRAAQRLLFPAQRR